MIEQFDHALLPHASRDEAARQDFAFALSRYVMNRVSPNVRQLYEQCVRSDFVEIHGREPQTRHEIRNAMEGHAEYQIAGILQRNAQELMWDAVIESVERELPKLKSRAYQLTEERKSGGTLRIDPTMVLPRYLVANHAHCMPGGYCASLDDRDISAGAIYDRGSFLYGGGMKGELQDGIGKAALKFIQGRYPAIQPNRILELGCGIASSLVPFHDAFPGADIHGVDAGAAMLRYGHARAESLGKRLHLVQEDIERTSYPSGSFDLILCLAVLHETSFSAVHNIFAEARRLLKDGGMFVCAEQPQYEGVPPWQQFTRDWDTYNNNEPFWGAVHDMNLVAVAEKAGFERARIFEELGNGPAAANSVQSHAVVEASKIMGSDRGAGQFYFLWMFK